MPLGVHGRPEERHVVLPADHRTDTPHVGLEHRQGRAVAETPDQPFAAGRHQLSVLPQIAAVGPEKENRAVQRSAIALDDTDDEMGLVGARDGREPVDVGTGDLDRAVPIDPELFTSCLAARADRRAKVEAPRIGRHERLRKKRQARAAVPRIGRQIAHLLERARDVERHRRRLNNRHAWHGTIISSWPCRSAPLLWSALSGISGASSSRSAAVPGTRCASTPSRCGAAKGT